jgi:nicotinate-nucleotide--dimethylbenzimidazole phosphoribosyltransferase
VHVDIPSLDTTAMIAAVHRQAQLTKPEGSLGRLEALSIWLAGTQATCPPQIGVSAYPSEVTAQMVTNLLAGGAGANVLARQAGVGVRVEDLSVAADTTVMTYKVRRSSGRIDVEDALSPAEVEQAISAGRSIADSEIDAGTDLLMVGDLGIGNTTPCAVLAGLLTNTEPVAVVGRGTGINDEGWMRKVTVVRDAMRRVRSADALDDPVALLRIAGGADLAATVGLLVQAASRRTPVLLDGVVSCVCALLAERIAPGASAWQIAAHRSPEPAQTKALAVLQHEPLLDLGLRLGEGTGALLAVPLLAAAAATLAQMATFEDAGVSGRDD